MASKETYGYESGYGSGSPEDQPVAQSGQYGYETGYGSSNQSQASNSPEYSLSGIAQNILPDIGRQIAGTAMQVKQGLYDVPKDVITAPAQVLQGTPIGQTDLAQFTRQGVNGMAQGVKDFASDPIGAIYRNPVTTALTAASVGSKIPNIVNSAGTKFISAALGPSQEAIEARMANPEGIANASSYSDIANKLPDTLNTLKDQISKHTEDAYPTLRNSSDLSQGAIPKSQLVDIWGNLMKKLQTDDTLVGPAKKAAADKLTSIVDDALEVSKGQMNLTEAHLKGILQSIDPNIDWTDKGSTASNSILTDLRGQLDQKLKTGNPEYAKAMQPVSEKLGLLEALQKAFNITNRTGEGLQPTDSTISKIQSLPTERKSITQGLANELKKATGQDLIQQSKNYGYSRQFQGGAANGSRRVASFGGIGTAIGAGAGKLLGSPTAGAITGQALGGAAGLLADKYGGSIAGSLVDRYAPVYQGISRITSSAPAQALSPVALQALLAQYYAQKASQRPSQ